MLCNTINYTRKWSTFGSQVVHKSTNLLLKANSFQCSKPLLKSTDLECYKTSLITSYTRGAVVVAQTEEQSLPKYCHWQFLFSTPCKR